MKQICDEDGVRLDHYLTRVDEAHSRSYLQKLIGEGCVRVNGVRCTSKQKRLSVGDCVEIQVPEPKLLEVSAENIPLDIVYEDDVCMVINKPQGMVVHPGAGNTSGTLVNALMHTADRLSGINGVIRPGIVHRIDKDTSGLLMVAKNDQAHEALAAQLKDKSALRVYVAIVEGRVARESGTIDAPLSRHPRDRKRQAIVTGGRRAVTHYTVLERFAQHTLVELRLETGRTHQIRVHMASIGYPLLGDPVYGGKGGSIKHSGQLLHAKQLGFRHPVSGAYMVFDSAYPEYFQSVLKKCRALKK